MTSQRWMAAAAALVTLSLAAPPARAVAQNASAITSVADGVFTADQVERGRKEFQIACASCHMLGEHTGKSFEGKWSGSTLGDFFDLVSNTMPESDPGSLKPEDYVSILAFFLSESGYKEGTTELPADLESLKKIRIDAPAR